MCTVCLGYGRKANSEMSKDGTKLIDKAIPALLEIHALLSNHHVRDMQAHKP
jgi:hypothetical protein